ncbi:META domain-containing protein [Flavobacterium sp.]
MKFKTSLLIAVILFGFASCSSKKEVTEDKLYTSSWELEYMSGPRIAFNGLFPDQKPHLSFNKTTKTVSGSDSCNGYSAPFVVNDSKLSFGEAGPATLMYCGEGEQQFRTMINKINRYSFDADGKLNFMIDDISVMRFKKK